LTGAGMKKLLKYIFIIQVLLKIYRMKEKKQKLLKNKNIKNVKRNPVIIEQRKSY
jgi:hypothetical protein